jgi:hypothetical protein
MRANLKIDQTATFAGLVFLSCQAKNAFGTDQQETTKDGRFKWECEVLGAAYTPFGGTSNEVLKVGIASRSNPAEGINPFTPVELGDFEVGVMEKTKKTADGGERVIGVTVWFRASEIKLAAAAATATAGSKAA